MQRQPLKQQFIICHTKILIWLVRIELSKSKTNTNRTKSKQNVNPFS